MTGWENWKPPANWRQIIEEYVEQVERLAALYLELKLTKEQREYLEMRFDQEIDNLRRGTFFRTDIEKKMR